MDNTCISCGRIIPEGRFICLHCASDNDMQQFSNEKPIFGKWIPCKDKLPPSNRLVICCYYGSDVIYPDYENGETLQECIERTRKCATVTCGFIGSDGWYGADWSPMMIQPSFWMPMPKPPEVK